MVDDADEVIADEEASSGGGSLKLIIAGVGAAVILGGGAAGWFTGVIPGMLGMTAEAETEEYAEGDEAPEPSKKKKGKKGKKGDGEDATTIVALEPIIISLPAQNEIRRKLPRLNVVIALEVTDPDYTEEKRPQLRNDLISTIRLIDAQTLNSPGGLDALRATIEEAAGGVLGPSLKQVLITEFILL